MGIQEFPAQKTANTTITTTAETVVLTFPAISTPNAGASVTLQADFDVTWGTATTKGTFRVRRGTDATGTLVGEGNALDYTAASTYDSSVTVVDTPGEVAGQVYVLTIQATSATGDSTCLFAAGTVTVTS